MHHFPRFQLKPTSQAEAYAVRLACRLAQAHNLDVVQIESDNQMIIKLYVSEKVPPWDSLAVLVDVRWMARNRRWDFVWTRRANNKVAHWVATAHAQQILPTS
ncbi:hypothetical protein ACSBR2_019265 [Camellia fascicularis]